MRIARIIILAFALLVTGSIMAQEDCVKAQKNPQQKEKVLKRNTQTRGGYNSFEEAYKAALCEAQRDYSGKKVGIRNLAQGELKIKEDGSIAYHYNYTIVELPNAVMQNLYEAVEKATRNVADESIFAIDQINVSNYSCDRNVAKSELIDYLLGKGYKVVAKEKLEKLYQEQQGYKSGLYNDKTKVKENNFSAVGYFISARITEEYVQVQVVNVSTDEFEGNVTLNL